MRSVGRVYSVVVQGSSFCRGPVRVPWMLLVFEAGMATHTLLHGRCTIQTKPDVLHRDILISCLQLYKLFGTGRECVRSDCGRCTMERSACCHELCKPGQLAGVPPLLQPGWSPVSCLHGGARNVRRSARLRSTNKSLFYWSLSPEPLFCFREDLANSSAQSGRKTKWVCG